MFTQGECMTMCPWDEVVIRERERLLHPLEIIPETKFQKYPQADRDRMVKSFSRSAAGTDLTNPKHLRPPLVLKRTIKYLMCIPSNNYYKLKEVCIYDFITDRLRSVSQDMVVQNLQAEDCIEILEPIVQFHVIYGYRLCEEKIMNFDPVLNKMLILEYLKRLLKCYDEIDNKEKENGISDDLLKTLKSLTLNDSTSHMQPVNLPKIMIKRELMEALYILCNLEDLSPLHRYLKLPSKYKSYLTNQAFQISICHLNKNFVKECQLISKLPTILLCGAILHLRIIRRYALHIMCHAYSSQVQMYPLDNIKNLLLYDSEEDVVKECNHYGIQIKNNCICFMKKSFNTTSILIQPCRMKHLDHLLNQETLENHLS